MSKVQTFPVYLQAGCLTSAGAAWLYGQGNGGSLPSWYTNGGGAGNASAEVHFSLPSDASQFGGKLLRIEMAMNVNTLALTSPIIAVLQRYNVRPAPSPIQTFTVNPATNLVTLQTGLYNKGQAVVLSSSGVMPAGLTAGTTYYIGNIDPILGLNCQLYPTERRAKDGGLPLVVTSAGSGTLTVTASGPVIDQPLITVQGTQVITDGPAQRKLAVILNSPSHESIDNTGLPWFYSLLVTFPKAATSGVAIIDPISVIYENPTM